jgi:hypothetical protein
VWPPVWSEHLHEPRRSARPSPSHGDHLPHSHGPFGRFWVAQPFLGGSAGHQGRNAHGIGRGGRRSGGRPDLTPHMPRPWAVGVPRGRSSSLGTHISPGLRAYGARHTLVLAGPPRTRGWDGVLGHAGGLATCLVCMLRQNHTLVFGLHHLAVM